MRIENWEKWANHRLSGEVYDSPKHEQGKYIVTSRVVKVDSVNQLVTTKSGSVYELGAVHPNYEKAFPNARERFFKEDYNEQN